MRVSVKVLPRSSRQEVIKNPDGSLKIYVIESATDGKANKSLIEILSDYYKVKKSNISIVKGQTSRNKIIEIEGV